jgi:cytochrome c oxidase subunit 2
MSQHQHLTTRRSFITTLGFGGVALYGAWAAYGAAPLPFIRLRDKDAGASPNHLEAGHGAHGGAGSMTPEEFLRRHEEFMARFGQPDGSVMPQVSASAANALPQDLAAGQDRHAAPQAPTAGHDVLGRVQHGAADADQHQAHAPAGHETAVADPSVAQPIDLYLLAYRFGFTPDDMRLEAGQSYRIRMMASDITHGASLQLGRGSRIIRLRSNVVSDLTITFKRRGPVLVYCTVFCGPAHDAMKARIMVA